MKTVTIVIASHQGRRFLPRCLSALARCQVPAGWATQVIVSDNGSSDGTGALVRADFPSVELLESVPPLGFGGANNAARPTARGEVVVFLNNDTEVAPEWLMRPLKLLERDPSVAAVGSKLLYMHRYQPWRVEGEPGQRVAIDSRVHNHPLDQKVRWSAGAKEVVPARSGWARWFNVGDTLYLPDPVPGLDEKPWRPTTLSVVAVSGDPTTLSLRCGDSVVKLCQRFPGLVALPPEPLRVELVQNAGGQLSRQGEGGDFGAGTEASRAFLDEETVPSLCGAALFVRRADLDAVGWFPPDYVVYYEDTHLSLRLRQGGTRSLVFCPASVVRHYHTGTNREWSPFFIENVVRSRLIFTATFGGAPLLARVATEQGTHAVRELLAHARRSPWAAWEGAPGFRGIVKSLRAVARIEAQKALAPPWRRPAPPLETLSLERGPYRAPSAARE